MINAHSSEWEMIISVVEHGLTPDSVDVIDKISPEMIEDGFLNACWEQVIKLHASNEVIDPISVFEAVDKEGGLMTYIDRSKSMSNSKHNVKGYAKRVRQAYYLREAYKKISQAKSAIENCKTVNELSETSKLLEEAISGLVLETDTKLPRAYDEIMVDYIDLIDKRSRGDSTEMTVKTGIDPLDALTGGFNHSDLIGIGGCPGMGKTELVVSIMRGVAKNNQGALMFSMEMDEFQVVERAISGEAMLPVSTLRNAQGMTSDDFTMFTNGAGLLKGKDFYIHDQAGLSIAEVCSIATRHKHEHPNLSVIAIDYLGLMKIGKADRHDIALGDISRRLKQLAKDLKVPVILLVQLVSKSIDARPITDRKPRASDIKDSSRLQDDMDWIIFPYRHKVYDKEAHNYAEIALGKARHGTQGATAYQIFKDGHFVDCDQAMAKHEIDEYMKSRQQTSGSNKPKFMKD